jgi:cytochrome c-type biogenesis protein CcmH/NrfG
MPSAVVIDKQGRVVHAVAGLTSRFSDVLTDSVLFAAGKLSAERLEQTLNPQASTAPGDVAARADRLTQLARQLARRGLDELAAEKYAEALKLNAHHLDAHLGLGKLLLKRRRLAEAEVHLREVLVRDPGSEDGMLGLAFIQTLRGKEETPEAEKTVRAVLAKNPSQPRAHFLLGLIQEQRERMGEAAASFKRAAQLLLERSEQE